ncbi:hypothetical protein CMK19_04640 [Candidatus Poribacteria bacterium]|nr:hypothetical protein [Candidatus Poribacteria bacterium]MEE2911018.1 hypothetical protein [Candidatus Poribacteria bacterium]|tara:strand:- start:531 stop:1106 length:576 start_codon:yes stop_codon:yes gene_type:complete
MVRILAFLSIIFYFFAVFFGMMFYFDNFSEQDEKVMSAGELYGYSAIQLTTPEMAKKIQSFLEEESKIKMQIENLNSQLKKKELEETGIFEKVAEAKKKLQKYEKDLARYEKGEKLADLLLKLPAINAAETISTYSDLELRFFVEYAMPVMQADVAKEKLYKKLLQSIGPNKILATKISKFTIQKEERAND